MTWPMKRPWPRDEEFQMRSGGYAWYPKGSSAVMQFFPMVSALPSRGAAARVWARGGRRENNYLDLWMSAKGESLRVFGPDGREWRPVDGD